MATPNFAFGGGIFMAPEFKSSEDVQEYLSVLEEHGIKIIDTSAIYGKSEQFLGEAKAASRFTIDTKAPGAMSPEPSTKDVVVAAGKNSLEKLRTSQVDVYYIHVPDTRLPFAETLEGIDALYKSGAFRRFGLSNFSPEQTNEVLRICRERGFVLPTVYQGNYNAVGRLAESQLFPILRENNIAFYAYSPIAGGFLAKTTEGIKEGKGRWDPSSFLGKLSQGLYGSRPAMLGALDTWNKIAASEGIPASEMAFRWVFHNSILDGSKGDAVIVGASSPEQLRKTVAAVRKGPLSSAVQGQIQEMWEGMKHEAFLDNISGQSEELMKELGDMIKQSKQS
ncbi:hypothetical protein KVR01_005872 [Diaporthe batatas]|uniref:uncharacterized protein n=1 Tax=Diaporthe batatas TaxID=748121 RepID=UPI001D04303B|nr:uncharacterized protein KVR01_005872 [Diaporthe batatas]KAG8163954.1 hypothetical protein KVR01_005872 [Diaporthe batatas]